MKRLQHRLSARAVANLKEPGLYGDGGGLTLQITKGGVKSWLFRYMMAGKAHGMGLGATHTVTLAEARDKALAARKLILSGINPLVTKRQDAVASKLANARLMSFDQCAAAYIDAHRAGWRNAKHAEQWETTVKSYASPVFGNLPVAEVDTALVVKCLGPIWSTKTETASRLRGRIEAILGWATTSGYRAGENPARWKGHLQNLLATISKSSRTQHHPSLPWLRINEFFIELRACEGVAARALEFAILTACRSGEVRGARWSEFDLEKKVWTIPAERMKAKRMHEVPISEKALSVLNATGLSGEFVFPGRSNGQLSDMSLTAVIRRLNQPGRQGWLDAHGNSITVHGFRSTFRMWAAECTNYPREVAEHALAHQLPDAVERAYQRGSHFAKRASLMTEWAEFCEPS